jgi:hypothetical protein
MNRTRMLASAAAIAVFAATAAAATTLGGVSTGGLGAGGTQVNSCDSDGMTVNYQISNDQVTDVIVSGIADPGCEGLKMSVTLANSSGASIGSASSIVIPTDGDSTNNTMTIPVSGAPSAAAVTNFHIAVVD